MTLVNVYVPCKYAASRPLGHTSLLQRLLVFQDRIAEFLGAALISSMLD